MNNTYALVKNGVVQNIISASAAYAASIASSWDYVVQIDGLSPSPDVGWTYDGTSFAPPAENYAQDLTDALNSISSELDALAEIAAHLSAADADSAFSAASAPSQANASSAWSDIGSYISASSQG